MSALPSPSLVLEEVKKLASEHPERVATCRYASTMNMGDYPVCIVGHALHKLGVAIADLQEFDSWDECSIWDVYEPTVNLDLTVQELSDLKLVRRIQNIQDNGATWDYALRRAQADENAGYV